MKNENVVVSTIPERVRVDLDQMPRHESDRMCKTILECVRQMMEIPAIRAEYEEWLTNKQKANADTGQAGRSQLK